EESTPDFPQGVEAPQGAPNILLIFTDDVGFGASSLSGGPIQTPTFQRLANSGLRYNMFRTTGLCSPTRATLITGHNHHASEPAVRTTRALVRAPAPPRLVSKRGGAGGAGPPRARPPLTTASAACGGRWADARPPHRQSARSRAPGWPPRGAGPWYRERGGA